MAKPLLGAAWTKLYAGGDPGIDEVVPLQVVRALLTQLGHLREQFFPGAEMDTQAERTFAAIQVGAKRYRADGV